MYPEFLVGLKGDAAFSKQIRTFLYTHFDISVDTFKISEFLSRQPPLDVFHLLLQRLWLDSDRKIYKVAENFAHELAKIKRGVPLSKLPKLFTGYLLLPKHMTAPIIGEVEGAFVNIARHKLKDYIAITYISAEDRTQSYTSKINLTEKEYEEWSNGTDNDDLDTFIVNTVLYINSAFPDLQEQLGVISSAPTDKAIKLARKTFKYQQNLLPVINVGYRFEQERLYNVSDTWRRCHLRWQPCGVNRSEVKLVWVKGHPVKFKKTKELNVHNRAY